MKKVLSMIVTAVMVLSLFTGTVSAAPGKGNGHGSENGNSQAKIKEWKDFKDMKDHWGARSVQKMQSLGILGGYADGTFQPDKTLTHAELAVIIERLLELRQHREDDSAVDDDDDSGPDNEDDSDIEDDDDSDIEDEGGRDFNVEDSDFSSIPDWAKKAVKKGFQKHYLNQKRFHSQVQCDRLTACVAIAKALELEPVTDYANNPFKDRGLISDEDFGYLLALYEAGYIKGYPNGNFNPNSFLSRAQIASIIEKLSKDMEDEDSDDKEPNWDNDSTVTATAIRATSAELEWSAAEDNDKVTGYKVIYEVDDKDKVKYVSGRTVTVSGLKPGEAYEFSVEAKDAAGNWSDDGPSVTVTTLKVEGNDTENPTWPKDSVLTVSSSESGMVTLVWPDAEDNTGIDAYKIYKDGQLIKSVEADDNSLNIAGLKEDTEYTFKVRAVDKAGNMSTSLSKSYLTD